MLSLLVLSAVFGGCATPANYEGMVPPVIETEKKHPQTVSAMVTGGKETDTIGKSQISDTAFAQALTEAITQSKTFSRVVQGKGADYLLTVIIFSMDQPNFGLSFTVKMEAGWMLKRVENGQTVWRESIKSEHTATIGDAFVGATRLRLATEGAAKNNIAQGLAEISKLNL